MQPLAKFTKFDRGITTEYGRGEEYNGHVADCRNVLPTKIGRLETAFGFSQTGGLSSLPTGFKNPASGPGTYNMSKIVWDAFPYAAESPEAYDAKLWYMYGNSANHYVLDRWYKDGSRVTSPSTYVVLDDRKVISYDAAHTISGQTISIDDASTLGLVTTPQTDHYKNWLVQFYDSGTSPYYNWALITASSYDPGTDVLTLTTLETLSGGAATRWTNDWDSFATGDTLTLFRWFHRLPQMIPTFGSHPGRPFEANGRLRACGGAESSQHMFPWISQNINRTWFPNVTPSFTYNGTYVDEMECSPRCTDESVHPVTTAYEQVINISYASAGAGETGLPAGDYQAAYALEYDGYELSTLVASNATSIGSTEVMTYTLKVYPSRTSKRVTAIHIFVRPAGTVQGPWYYIRRHDIVAQSSDNNGIDYAAAADTWTWDDSGIYQFSGRMDGYEWANRGATYTEKTELAYDSTQLARHIVNWRHTEYVAGRRFFGYFYDPNDGNTYTDELRHTPITATENYDVIPAFRDEYETSVLRGDPQSITALVAVGNNNLAIFKSKSVYALAVGARPELWVLSTVSNRDGTESHRSVVQLPGGRIAFADNDFYKMLDGLSVRRLTTSIETTYRAFSNHSTVRGWWEQLDGSLRFTDGVDSTNRYVWVCYPDRPFNMGDNRIGFPMYKLQHTSGYHVEFVWVDRQGVVEFTHQSAAGTWVYHLTDYTYAGYVLTPYVKTVPVVNEESAFQYVEAVVLTKSTGASGILAVDIYYDDVEVVYGGTALWYNVDKTKSVLYLPVPIHAPIRMGRKVWIEYNPNPTGEVNLTGKIYLDSIELYGHLRKAEEKSFT